MFILNPSEYSLMARHGVLPPGAKESTRVPGEQNPVTVVPNRRDRRVMARGKPSKGTKKDRRLKRNRRRKR